MKRALILMTALLPTTGHADLVKFALSITPATHVDVIIHGRSHEPTTASWRRIALLSDPDLLLEHEDDDDYLNVIVRNNDDAPQNPEDHPDFWNWWANEIATVTNNTKYDYVVASEPYGVPLAQAIGAQFLPYDIPRSLNRAKCSDVRAAIIPNWNFLLPASKSLLSRRVTLFGQESVGKTTIAKALSGDRSGISWIPEYARPYLDAVGPDLSVDKMQSIWRGQYALQYKTSRDEPTPVVVQDTDLFSTVGYWKIGDFGEVPEGLIRDANFLSSDVYYILPDDVPFEPDVLRYGGDVRESTTQFWVDLLDEHLAAPNVRVVHVPEGSLHSKIDFIRNDIYSMLFRDWKEIREFKRD